MSTQRNPTPGSARTEPAEAPVTAGELLRAARRRLRSASFEPSPREASLLLAHCSGSNEASVLAHPERVIADEDHRRFRALLERRLRGEPVAYLLGEREFWGHALQVDSRVLIPRPETEHLVELALRQPVPPTTRAVDLGTGSGCLAISLALERPSWQLVATDRSPAALAVARRNVDRHGLEGRVRLVAGDLLAPLLSESFDLVLSNPPYVDPADRAILSPEITGFEPDAALFAEERGLAFYRRLLDPDSPLCPGTRLLLEIGEGQLDEVRRLGEQAGFELLEIVDDLAGRPRSLLFLRR